MEGGSFRKAANGSGIRIKIADGAFVGKGSSILVDRLADA